MADERPKATKERRGAQPIATLLDHAIEPALKARGFASSAIHMHWAEIVGPELARWSEPASLRWPPRPPGAAEIKEGATLTIRVEGAFALDLQHRAPQVIDRINGYFGWRCVERLAFKQGPVRKGWRRGSVRSPRCRSNQASASTGCSNRSTVRRSRRRWRASASACSADAEAGSAALASLQEAGLLVEALRAGCRGMPSPTSAVCERISLPLAWPPSSAARVFWLQRALVTS